MVDQIDGAPERGDMIGMGEASFGFHKEEDTLYNMQDYEGKKGR